MPSSTVVDFESHKRDIQFAAQLAKCEAAWDEAFDRLVQAHGAKVTFLSLVGYVVHRVRAVCSEVPEWRAYYLETLRKGSEP